MAECSIQGSFAFTCMTSEAALLEESWQHASDLLGGFEPGKPSPEFLAAFPPTQDENCFSGLLGIFDEAEFPEFGANMVVENALGDMQCCSVTIFSLSDFQPGSIASLIWHCCQQTLQNMPIGFEWSYSCSRPRVGSFGGGCCIIFSDRTEFRTTSDQLSEALHRADAPGDADPIHGLNILPNPFRTRSMRSPTQIRGRAISTGFHPELALPTLDDCPAPPASCEAHPITRP